MSRKLPALSSAAVVKALRRAGFSVERIKGSHHHLRNPDRPAVTAVDPRVEDRLREVQTDRANRDHGRTMSHVAFSTTTTLGHPDAGAQGPSTPST